MLPFKEVQSILDASTLAQRLRPTSRVHDHLDGVSGYFINSPSTKASATV
jgi:cAMP phosphodiesterase